MLIGSSPGTNPNSRGIYIFLLSKGAQQVAAIAFFFEMAVQVPSLLLAAAVVLMVLSGPGTEGRDSPSKYEAGLSRVGTLGNRL